MSDLEDTSGLQEAPETPEDKPWTDAPVLGPDLVPDEHAEDPDEDAEPEGTPG